MDQVRENHANSQKRRSQQHHRIRPDWFEKTAGHFGAKYRTQRAADSNNCKEPLSLILRVNVVRKGPELGSQHHIEKSNPQAERATDMKAETPDEIKQHNVRSEECSN